MSQQQHASISSLAPHIERHRVAILSIEDQTRFLMGWTIEKYTYNKYLQGLHYLRLVCQGDAEARAFLEASREFWGWWKNQWATRDEAFISEMDGVNTMQDRRAHYNLLQNAEKLWQETTYHGQALGKSYAAMIGLVNRSIRVTTAL